MAVAKASRISAMPSLVSASGCTWPSPMAVAVGPTSGQGFSPIAISGAPSGPLPSKARCDEPLRPAWPSCIAGTAPCALMKRASRCTGSICASDQSPRSPWVMRPSRITLVTSVKISPKPPTAKRPSCTICQSFAKPSIAEYWQSGGITTRLGIVTPRMVSGEKSKELMGRLRSG